LRVRCGPAHDARAETHHLPQIEETMQQILVYGDSLSWGIVPNTRQRFPFGVRWPGVLEKALLERGLRVRIIEDCLNGRRTAFDDPFKPGRNGLESLEQRIEINSPLRLVILFLGTNDFQSMHTHNAWHSAQGIAALVDAIRRAPIEPGMPAPEVLVVAPPPVRQPRGPIAPKFLGAEPRSFGLAAAYAAIARERGCEFFDAGQVAPTSTVDGVHLDADQHQALGFSLAAVVAKLLESSSRSDENLRMRKPRTARKFFAGAVRYDGCISMGYHSSRALSADTTDLWCAILKPLLATLARPTVLDLGCGTGRFSVVIGGRFDARVVGIEPSWPMLRIASQSPSPNVSYAGGRAETLPLRDHSFDIAWLSHVIHHIVDRDGCARELARVLRADGRVLMRGTFGDRIDGFPTLFHFFPAARGIAAQFPSLAEVTAAFDRAGLLLESVRRVQQTTCIGLRELARRTRSRADSTLALLADAEFQRCQSALEQAAEREAEATPVIETLDFLVLRRPG
jgi:ubiquinone/menaquinone biosynthesis C-methylase UbiE/lysophospholipase L1-like esterase